MEEHVGMLKEEGLPIPQENEYPTITIQNEKKARVVA